MFKFGIRLLAARSVRYVRANMTPASQHSRPFLARNMLRSSPLRALSVLTLSSASGLYVRADNSEEDAVVHEQHPTTENLCGWMLFKDNVEPSKILTKLTIANLLDILEKALYKMMDSESRTFLYGVTAANLAISSAFALGFFLKRPPKPRPTLLRFLSRNFVLSQGWVNRGRWHVLLTSMFAHLRVTHLARNMLALFGSVWLCSEFLDVWQIAGLYFGGGLVGGSVSIALTKMLRKHRYLASITGASDGIYALWFYYACAEDLELGNADSFPIGLIVKAFFLRLFVVEGVGLRKYIRYGYVGTGYNAVSADHGAHLGGAATGLAAYGVPRALEYIRRDVSSNDDNNKKGARREE